MTEPAILSVVIPVFNEERILPELHRRVSAALESLGLAYEVIAVNDGSLDGSLAALRAIRGADNRWKILDLSRNFGHGSACTAGLQYASGAAVLFLDADLQDPPELIADFVRKWKEGYQIVYGVRSKRRESLLRRAVTHAFYRTMNFFSETPLPLDVGIFSLMDRQAADHLKSLPERQRYLTGLRNWVGFRQAAVPYERDGRAGSLPTQTWVKLCGLAADAIFSFSVIPLRLATLLGGLLALFSFGLGARILYQKLFTDIPIIGWSSTMLALLVIGGMILVTLGIIGEYVGRIYNEIKQRPLFIVREAIGLDRA